MKKICLSLALAAPLFASVAHISAIRGDAIIIRGGKEFSAKINDKLEPADVIKTTAKSRLQVIFKDATVATIGRNTTFKIDDVRMDGKNSAMRLEVPKGSFKVISGEISRIARQNFALKADTATIGIRGTVFVGEISPQNSAIACLAGAIDVRQGGISRRVSAGRQIGFTPGKLGAVSKLQMSDFSLASAAAEATTGGAQMGNNAGAAVGASGAASGAAAEANSAPKAVLATHKSSQKASETAINQDISEQTSQAPETAVPETAAPVPPKTSESAEKTEPVQKPSMPAVPAQPQQPAQPAAPSGPAAADKDEIAEKKAFVKSNENFYYGDKNTAAKFEPSSYEASIIDNASGAKISAESDEIKVQKLSGGKLQKAAYADGVNAAQQAGHGGERAHVLIGDGKNSVTIDATEQKFGAKVDTQLHKKDYSLQKSSAGAYDQADKSWENSVNEYVSKQPAGPAVPDAPKNPGDEGDKSPGAKPATQYYTGGGSAIAVDMNAAKVDAYTTGELKGAEGAAAARGHFEADASAMSAEVKAGEKTHRASYETSKYDFDSGANFTGTNASDQKMQLKFQDKGKLDIDAQFDGGASFKGGSKALQKATAEDFATEKGKF